MYVFWTLTNSLIKQLKIYPVIDNGRTERQYPFLCVINCADSISLFPLWLKFFIFNVVLRSSTNSISKFEQNFKFNNSAIFFAIFMSPLPILIIFCFAFNSAKMLITCSINLSVEMKKELEISFPRYKLISRFVFQDRSLKVTDPDLILNLSFVRLSHELLLCLSQ